MASDHIVCAVRRQRLTLALSMFLSVQAGMSDPGVGATHVWESLLSQLGVLQKHAHRQLTQKNSSFVILKSSQIDNED